MKNQDFHIIAQYFRKPRNPNKTAQKGYMSNPDNFFYEESVNITRGLKTKDRDRAELIINLNQQQVIRNSKGEGETFEQLLYYFQKNYPDDINPVLAYIYPEEMNHEDDVQATQEKSSRPQRSSETDSSGSREGDEGVQNSV